MPCYYYKVGQTIIYCAGLEHKAVPSAVANYPQVYVEHELNMQIICMYELYVICVFCLKVWQYGTIYIDLSYGVMVIWKFETCNLYLVFFNALEILVKLPRSAIKTVIWTIRILRYYFFFSCHILLLMRSWNCVIFYVRATKPYYLPINYSTFDSDNSAQE